MKQTVESAPDSVEKLEWKSVPYERPASKTVHLTDNYVVHGRGFTTVEAVYYDEFSLYREHIGLWNDWISEEENYEKCNDHWGRYQVHKIDFTPLYWSVTGSPCFVLQHPTLDALTGEEIRRLYQTLKRFEWPTDHEVKFHRRINDTHGSAITRNESEFTESIQAGKLYDLINDI